MLNIPPIPVGESIIPIEQAVIVYCNNHNELIAGRVTFDNKKAAPNNFGVLPDDYCKIGSYHADQIRNLKTIHMSSLSIDVVVVLTTTEFVVLGLKKGKPSVMVKMPHDGRVVAVLETLTEEAHLNIIALAKDDTGRPCLEYYDFISKKREAHWSSPKGWGQRYTSMEVSPSG